MKANKGKTPDDVTNVVKNLQPGLTSSYNIGLADFYPSTSGKENAAQYIVDKFNTNLAEAFLLCDDDNDMGEQHVTDAAANWLSMCGYACVMRQHMAVLVDDIHQDLHVHFATVDV